jgi:predicted Fe-Mo cluster-binding NifX family protein
MQVALTVWEGRISPLFDATRMLLVANITERTITAWRYVPLECDSAFSRAAKLADLGVTTLICGGISELFANAIEAQGIRLIPFVSGTVQEVLDAYLNGQVNEY